MKFFPLTSSMTLKLWGLGARAALWLILEYQIVNIIQPTYIRPMDVGTYNGPMDSKSPRVGSTHVLLYPAIQSKVDRIFETPRIRFQSISIEGWATPCHPHLAGVYLASAFASNAALGTLPQCKWRRNSLCPSGRAVEWVRGWKRKSGELPEREAMRICTLALLRWNPHPSPWITLSSLCNPSNSIILGQRKTHLILNLSWTSP